MLFRQLFDQTSSTYSYLLADEASKEAVLIDCVYEQYERDLALISELGLTLLACIETHCHADHVTGAWLMKLALKSEIFASAKSGIEPLGRRLERDDEIKFGAYTLKVIETPGHTDGCISLLLADQAMVFTGDALLIRGAGRTDFQQGSASKLFHSIQDRLFTLPAATLVYPAHDYGGRTVSSIEEEKRLNTVIGGNANEGDFVGYMDNIGLPHPKKLNVAVPANLKAGRPPLDELPWQPDWAPVTTTFSGMREISSQWVAGHMEDVFILDVRTTVETAEESARIKGAKLLPINELRARLDEVPRDVPVVTICRSGKRSALAYRILRESGMDKVASIVGGLLQWQAEGLPVDEAS